MRGECNANYKVGTVLNQIWEEDLLGFSYGFRPGRGQQDALDALWVGIVRKKVNWILDFLDIRSFFDKLQQAWAGPVCGTSDRRPAGGPPDPEMAEGGREGSAASWGGRSCRLPALDYLPARLLLPPCPHPQIQDVMQVEIGIGEITDPCGLPSLVSLLQQHKACQTAQSSQPNLDGP